MKPVWKEFEVYAGCKSKALLVDGKLEGVKLISHVPGQHYYSFLNQAGLEAELLFTDNLKSEL